MHLSGPWQRARLRTNSQSGSGCVSSFGGHVFQSLAAAFSAQFEVVRLFFVSPIRLRTSSPCICMTWNVQLFDLSHVAPFRSLPQAIKPSGNVEPLPWVPKWRGPSARFSELHLHTYPFAPPLTSVTSRAVPLTRSRRHVFKRHWPSGRATCSRHAALTRLVHLPVSPLSLHSEPIPASSLHFPLSDSLYFRERWRGNSETRCVCRRT